MENNLMEKELTPFWYAVGGFFMAPVLSILFAFVAVFLLILWPFIPVLLYFERKENKNDFQKS